MRAVVAAALLCLSFPPAPARAVDDGAISLPAGNFEPAFTRNKAKAGSSLFARPVHVDAFRLDAMPVTNGAFLAFVEKHPEWRKSRVARLFADEHYLDRWPADLSLPKGVSARAPVTNVSWFAAKAYCEAQGASLPTTDQWEYALFDQGRDAEAVRARILEWYGAPNPEVLPAVDTASANGFGVRGLAGLIWEWTLDYSSATPGSDLRGGGNAGAQFCGGAGAGAKDASDYAAFMRYSFRASLEANFTTNNLGFRCARSAP